MADVMFCKIGFRAKHRKRRLEQGKIDRLRGVVNRLKTPEAPYSRAKLRLYLSLRADIPRSAVDKYVFSVWEEPNPLGRG